MLLALLWPAALVVLALAAAGVRGARVLLGVCLAATTAAAGWALVAPVPAALVALALSAGLALACAAHLRALVGHAARTVGGRRTVLEGEGAGDPVRPGRGARP